MGWKPMPRIRGVPRIMGGPPMPRQTPPSLSRIHQPLAFGRRFCEYAVKAPPRGFSRYRQSMTAAAHQLAFNPLRNAAQMASLIAEVTGDSIDRVLEKLEIERRHPGRSVAEDFARHGARLYTDSPEMSAFYESTDAFLYELAVWNCNML